MRAPHAIVPEHTVSVSRLANYLTRKLNLDLKLRRLGVSGEISGFTPHPGSGNLYFDLKDRDALIKCVVWGETAATLPPLANGQAVVAIGSVVLYPKKGYYQLNVIAVELAGAGRLHVVYEALKRRLEVEGLFAQARKRPLPRYPFHVGLISSRAANGAGDFIAQAALLAPHVTITLFETPVQGDSAAPEIVRAIGRASRADLDLVVLARGGGSYEDLFVFNDERVVRAFARCAHPTVSAIGHEADVPLTDFVADRREATPSSAARGVLPHRTDLLRAIDTANGALVRCATRAVERHRRDLSRIEVRSPLASPERLLQARRVRVDAGSAELEAAVTTRWRGWQQQVAALRVRLERCNPSVRLGARRERLTLVTYKLERAAREALARRIRRCDAVAQRLPAVAAAALADRRTQLELVSAKLEGRDPTRILARGYAIVTVDGVAVRDASTIEPGTRIAAQLARGRLVARVEPAGNDGGK